MLGMPGKSANAVSAQLIAMMKTAKGFSGPLACPADRRSIELLVLRHGLVPGAVFRHRGFLNRQPLLRVFEKIQGLDHRGLEGARRVVGGDESRAVLFGDRSHRVDESS